MKFTKEEISLCKQIAEKHRKKIEYGDWYWDKGIKKAVVESIKLGYLQDNPYFIKNCFPLWTISDCLEFLREKKEVIELWRAGRGSNWICRIKSQRWWSGKTSLEACLKAVLAVLEESE